MADSLGERFVTNGLIRCGLNAVHQIDTKKCSCVD
jgi:hypothetical protein